VQFNVSELLIDQNCQSRDVKTIRVVCLCRKT